MQPGSTASPPAEAEPDRAGPSLGFAMAAVAVIGLIAGLAGIDARATYGARVTSDEPQYLLTAISLGEDASLDISDELADERFLPFHEIALNTQTVDLDDDGRRVSPHDPLLPLLLAGPMRLGGWPAAKATLAVVAAMVAALTLRLAVTRLSAPLGPATAVVAGFAAAPPFSVYGAQVYPAIVAALLVVIGALAVIEPVVGDGGTRHRSTAQWLAIAVVIGLPWLSVKYVPVAAVIAVGGLWRSWRSKRAIPVTALAVYVVAGAFYLAFHQAVYGGWTVYASGDHFVAGEWLVVGNNPNYVGRSRRLIGLIIDREFGLAAWNPAYLAAPAAMIWLARTRRRGWLVLTMIVVAGWATATWVALTMHGWWWPGRQVVPVLPLVVAAVAGLVGPSRRMVGAVVAACVIGAISWLWLAWEASTGRRTLIVDFDETSNPWYRFWRQLLADHVRMDWSDVALTAAWVAMIAATCVVVWRRSGPDPDRDPQSTTTLSENRFSDASQRSRSIPPDPRQAPAAKPMSST